MGYIRDSFGWGLGFSFGATATAGAMDAVSNNYRAKHYDPVVRRDLKTLISGRKLEKTNNPFPKKIEKERWSPFILRHKFFTISFILMTLLIGAVFSWTESPDVMDKMSILFVLYLFISFVVLLLRKIKRGGKRVAGNALRGEFFQAGQQYWKIRQYVCDALNDGLMTTQEAFNKLANTELARMLPDTMEELEASVYYERRG